MALDFASFLDIVAPDSPRPGVREPIVAAATGRHETRRFAAAPFRCGQAVLGIGIQDLAEVARRTPHRKARYSGPLAPEPISKALGSEVPVQRASRIEPSVRVLIRRMCRANPLWGAPRIHGELLKLGVNVAEATVSKYMIRDKRPPSQSWHSFLENHAKDIIAVDFLTVPTATFRVLFVLVILSHARRKILHTNATEHPTATWTARQLLEAIGIDDVPTYLLHDRDAIFGTVFKRQAASAGLREIITAPRSPWQNPYVERVIGSMRRECLDHTIVLGERHLRRVVGNYARYYNRARTHLSLEKDAPATRAVHPPGLGSIVSKAHCGGLHHEYLRAAA